MLFIVKEKLLKLLINEGVITVKVKNNQQSLKQHIIDVINIKKDKCEHVNYNNCDYQIFILDYTPNKDDFPRTKAFICMHSHKRSKQADYNPEAQYFISSSNNPKLIMETIDNRWQIEGNYH
ncbi:MAG: hypothetical protein ACI4V7_01650 [Succinivibrionaceae bacterium]